MRTPRIGESYQVCVHLENSSPSVERHYWYVPGKPWITLCAACHGRYSDRSSVEVVAAVRLFSRAPEVDAQTVCAVHAHFVVPAATADGVAEQAAIPKLPWNRDPVVDALRQRVREVCREVLLPEWGCSPLESAKQIEWLRSRYLEEKQRIDAGQPVNLSATWQLCEIDSGLTRLESYIKLAEQTKTRMQKLMRRAKRLLDQTLQEPGRSYYYRRRVYRRLVREHDGLKTLGSSHNLPRWFWPQDWSSTLSATFSALQMRYGCPLSDAEIRRIVSQISLADLVPLPDVLEHCNCDICASGRKNVAMETDAYLAVLADCSCAYCKFCRTTLWKIDVTKLEKAPAYRDAMLLLRHRLGGPSSLN